VRGNLAALPVPNDSADVVTTLQVIEHVWDHNEFVHECLRVLRPGGLLFVTTPNRLTFSAGSDTPVNPFHTKEFTAAELSALLDSNGFELRLLLGLHAGPPLTALDERYGGSFVDVQLACAPDEWDERLHADVEAVTAEDFAVHAASERDVDASLDLLVLATKPL
jgi:SAM-dependent methyltransferase